MDSSFLQAALFTGVGAFCVGIVLTLIGFALHATAAASGGHRFSPRVGGSLAEGLTQLVEHALLALADLLGLEAHEAAVLGRIRRSLGTRPSGNPVRTIQTSRSASGATRHVMRSEAQY
ncbi:MAG TPA: hypothetical protein VFJ28_05100 [Marmoricola sp.]|nr:hypothetical protein [Marmoricola sp.]